MLSPWNTPIHNQPMCVELTTYSNKNSNLSKCCLQGDDNVTMKAVSASTLKINVFEYFFLFVSLHNKPFKKYLFPQSSTIGKTCSNILFNENDIILSSVYYQDKCRKNSVDYALFWSFWESWLVWHAFTNHNTLLVSQNS